MRFPKWGLGLFHFGVFLSFGMIAHYLMGSKLSNGEMFMKSVTLWWACPWTLSVAAVQAGAWGWLHWASPRSDLKMTARYAHLGPAHLRAGVDALDGLTGRGHIDGHKVLESSPAQGTAPRKSAELLDAPVAQLDRATVS